MAASGQMTSRGQGPRFIKPAAAPEFTRRKTAKNARTSRMGGGVGNHAAAFPKHAADMLPLHLLVLSGG